MIKPSPHTSSEPSVLLPGDDPAIAAGSRARVAQVLSSVAAASVLFPLSMFVIATAGFAVGQRLGAWVAPVSAVISLLSLRLFNPSWRAAALPAGITIAVHIAAGFVASAFFDISWDGMVFHQEASLRLAAGWNPVFDNAGDYGFGEEIWLNHYAKALWISQGALYIATGHIELSKLFHFTLMAAAGCEVGAALLSVTRLRPVAVAGLSLVTALNPVAVYQSATFYLDGVLASSLTIVVVGVARFLVTPRWSLLAVPMAALSFCVNVKVNALPYAVVLLAFAVVAAWRWHGFRVAWRLAVVAAAVGAVGVLGLGYSPYVRNLREKGSMFYPYAVTPAIVDTGSQRPVNLNNKDRLSRFLISSFSYSERVRPPEATTLKVPFLTRRAERRAFGADIEAGGFGPYYGALFLLATIGAIGLLANKSNGSQGRTAVLIAAAVFVSIFVHSETWWARYVPQGWLVPLFIALGCLVATQRRALRGLGWAMLVIAAINVSYVSLFVARRQYFNTHEMNLTLREMQASPQPIKVDFGGFRSLRRRLEEANVAFALTETPHTGETDGWHAIPGTNGLAQWSK